MPLILYIYVDRLNLKIYAWPLQTIFAQQALHDFHIYVVFYAVHHSDKTLMNNQATELVELLWKKVLSSKHDSIISDLIRTPSRLLFTAAKLGNVDFLIILMRLYPSLIWKVDEKNQSIFHTAVVHRQEKVFNLIYELGGLKDLIASYKDEGNNTILHLAAKLHLPID